MKIVPKNSIHTEQKECVVCQRVFTNRKKFAKRGQWDEVKYCSNACRKNKNKK